MLRALTGGSTLSQHSVERNVACGPFSARPARHDLRMAQHHSSSSNAAHADKVIGCILAAMCGDALGCSVEGWDAKRIAKEHRDGLTYYQRTERGHGCYTDDSQMLLALAASLVNTRGRCCAADAALQYARAFDPHRGYSGSTAKILLRLQQGADPAATCTLFMPQGSFGNRGAMRIAPVGLVLRNATLQQLHVAVEAALLCTHSHPAAVEGALTLALAVAEACKMCPPGLQQQAGAGEAAGGGVALLRLLQQRLVGAISQEMAGKLALLEQAAVCLLSLEQAAVQQLPKLKTADQAWGLYLASPAWQKELAVAGQVAPGFQIRATDAVAASLWAAVCHWTCPADAVVAAVHYGGDTDTLACMTGALLGALHGSSWIPPDWLEQLENGRQPPPPSDVGDHQQQSFFADAEVGRVLAAGDLAAAAAANDGRPVELVLTTRDIGRDAAVVLAQLLVLLD